MPDEAETIRTLFRLYRELRSAWKVKQEADRLGLRTKLRTFKDGRTSGGGPFRHGHIHRILHNPLYIGQIQHKGVVNDGQHEEIIDLETWEATRIGGSTESERRRLRKTRPSPYALRGKLVDETGVPLETTHSTKKGRRYCYCLSSTKTPGGLSQQGSALAEVLLRSMSHPIGSDSGKALGAGSRADLSLRTIGMSHRESITPTPTSSMAAPITDSRRYNQESRKNERLRPACVLPNSKWRLVALPPQPTPLAGVRTRGDREFKLHSRGRRSVRF